jgi:phosphate ABC transporter phosphate-binding protein
MARRVAFVGLLAVLVALAPAVHAQSYQRISGEGSSWAAGAIDDMRVNVKQFGITVDYNPSGSSAGRKNYLNGTVDFAASDIPFQFRPEDGSAPEKPEPGSYAYIPVTAGGTAFMYNLKINGQRVTNLRLSGENVAKVFTGVITRWNDPALKADNPGLVLPDRKVVPVVRSDGSGSTAQFTRWMINQHSGIWNDYCKRSGRAPACGSTSVYPTITGGAIAQSGDLGVSSYITQGFAEGAIGYVNYSYSLSAQFPVAKVLNAAGYYTEPTPENVAVSLLKAKINRDAQSDDYLTQQLDEVYTDPDKRNYQLSSYSYFILPTKVKGQFNSEKGRTLGAFTYYAMCQAQQQSASLGYSPMPINLVQSSFEQIRKVPGVVVQQIDISTCKNPTFSADGTNVLAKNAPVPQECDKKGSTQCGTGTGGVKAVNTPVSGGGSQAAGGGAATGGGGAGQGGGANPASPGGGAATAGAGSATAGTSTETAAGTSTDPSPTSSADPSSCDPDTGVCPVAGSTDLSSASRTAAAGSTERAAAVPTVLVGSTGRAGFVVLTALIVLLTIGLVFGPPAAWLHFSAKKPQ